MSFFGGNQAGSWVESGWNVLKMAGHRMGAIIDRPGTVFSQFLQNSIRKGSSEMRGPKLAIDYYLLVAPYFRTAVYWQRILCFATKHVVLLPTKRMILE